MDIFSNEGSRNENSNLITARVMEVRFINDKEGNPSLELVILSQ